MTIEFDGRVVIVTGAGQGLGRAYATAFARSGARVLVNDLGSTHEGLVSPPGLAEVVADEINSTGGIAFANGDTVANAAGGASIVAAALDQWGRIDAVVCNAGVMRDHTFLKATDADFDDVFSTHYDGALNVVRPAFRHMVDSETAGRIVLTTSTSAMFGVIGQAAYASAKAALIGLTKVLSLEGERYAIVTNAVAPVAVTRLMPQIPGGHDPTRLGVDMVAPLVLALAHETCRPRGRVFIVGAGSIRPVSFTVGAGVELGRHDAQDVHDLWDVILEGAAHSELDDGMAVIPALLGSPHDH